MVMVLSLLSSLSRQEASLFSEIVTLLSTELTCSISSRLPCSLMSHSEMSPNTFTVRLYSAGPGPAVTPEPLKDTNTVTSSGSFDGM